MGGRRTVITAVALVLAVLAGGAAYLYLHDVQRRAYNNATLTTVYTVQSAIPHGTPASTVIAKGLVKRAQIPEQFLPSGAVTDLATIRNEVAAADLSKGEVLVAGQFASPTALVNSPSAAVPKGDVAITVSVDPVHGVAGLVHPGDQVDVLIETSAGAEQFLYQNVPVLAIGTSVAPGANVTATNTAANTTATTTAPAAASGLVTFAVPAAAAQRIALAESGGGGVTGSLYLALVPPGNTAAPLPPINSSNLIPATPTP